MNELKEKIQVKHNAVLEFNELLKENEIRSIEQFVNTLINEVFANKNRLENLQLAQTSAAAKLKEFEEKLQELDEKHRSVFTLRHLDGLALKEIAEVLEINEGTVKSRLFYATKFLANQLSVYQLTQ